MNLNENNKYQLIDDFLSGGMSKDDVDKFKAYMQGDSDLSLDINLINELEEATQFIPLSDQLKNTLSQIKQEEGDVKGGKSSGLIIKTALVALILAGLLFTMFKFFNPTETEQSPTQMYLAYAEIEPLELTTKSAEAQFDLRALQDYYNAKDFQNALPEIDKYLTQKPKDLDILLAKGISLMNLNQLDQAQQVFSQISSLGPRVKKSQWFSALAYLKAGKSDQAKTLLTAIVETKSYNYQKAKTLLANL